MIIIGGRAHTIEEIHEVGKYGYPYAEISIEDPEEIKCNFNELLELKEKYNIYYLAHYPNEGNPVNTKALKEKFLPKMKRLLDLSNGLGIRKGTMHFWMDKRWAESSLISAKIELLSEMTAYASRNDIVLCIENLTERYESFSPVCDAIADLRITLDIGHAELLSSENTSYGFIEHLLHRIEHVHVHDNHGGTGVKDDLHLALGEGKVDYPKILSLLNEKRYNNTITLEVKPSDMSRTKEAVNQYIS